MNLALVFPGQGSQNKTMLDGFSNIESFQKTIDKKAYLSSLKLADHIVVTCDSTSMISEAAMTGKPIYVAQMKPNRNNSRFRKFLNYLNHWIL